MPESILESIKLMLGVPSEYDVFDHQIAMHINSAFSTLNQLGVGPHGGFTIEGKDEKWSEFLQERKDLDLVKSYMYAWVRLRFDAPQNAFLVTALKDQIEEDGWRLKVQAETTGEVIQNGT